jgi:hypothetical protein
LMVASFFFSSCCCRGVDLPKSGCAVSTEEGEGPFNRKTLRLGDPAEPFCTEICRFSLASISAAVALIEKPLKQKLIAVYVLIQFHHQWPQI